MCANKSLSESESGGFKKLKVAQVITSVVLGGGGQVMSAIARNIDKSKFEMDIYCVIEGGELVEYIRSLGFSVTVLPVFASYPFRHYSLGRWLDLARLLRRGGYDVVHTHLFHADLVGGLAALKAGRRAIVKTLHNMGTTKTTYHHNVDAVLNRFTRKIVCVSKSQRSALILERRFDPTKATTIYNGVDVSRFKTTFDRQAVAASLGLDSSRPIIGTVGRLIEEKGQTYLLRAIPEIARRHPGIQLLIVGDGPLRKTLEGECGQLWPTKVVITGLRSDVPRLLSLMDLFVFPSLSEAFGIALIEAMAAGVPVACSDIPALMEIVRHRENGIVFRTRDPHGLAAAVCSLLDDAALRSSLSGCGLEVVQNEFSEGAMVRAYERLYIEQASG